MFFDLCWIRQQAYSATVVAPLKSIKEVHWTYVAGAVIVGTEVYLWSRAAHPLLRGVRRQAGGMYKRGKNYVLITSNKTYSSKIGFPKISRFREAGKNTTPPVAEIQKSWRNNNHIKIEQILQTLDFPEKQPVQC